MAVLLLAAGAAVVAGGAATNQVLGNGTLNWHWAYLAFGFMVLASVFTVHATRSTGPAPASERWTMRGRRAYLRQLRASVMDMETIGVVTHGEFVLRMRQVYVDVSLRPRPVQDAARDTGVGPMAPEPVGERRSLRSFLGGGRVFAVIGTSGSGKTTLVRHTALAMCGWHWRFWRRRQLPVLLYLRDHAKLILSEEPPGLPGVAIAAGWLDGKISSVWLGRRLDKGRCVILLDGLDEVADELDRQTVVAWVRRQIERYPANSFVLTSRPHGYIFNSIPNADVLQVQRFTGDQISSFLHHWYYAVECRTRGRSGKHVRMVAGRQADDLLRKLRSGPAMYELAANPLLLTMIANVHKYRSALPRSRAALYAEMCDALIHRRQAAKNLTDTTGLEGPKKERVMRHLALYMMRERLRDIAIIDAQRAIRRPLRQVTVEHQITPEFFLDEIRKSGLLVEREQGVCGFAHLTFQEYLAAAHIQKQSADYLHLLTDGVDDPWWRETTLLWAAASDATSVIDACLASGGIRALTLAFDCADEALEISPGTRDRLNDFLNTPDAVDQAKDAHERRRLIAVVTASRSLREVIWLGSTAVCARPVNRNLYNLFALHEQVAGRHTQILPTSHEVEAEQPAVGMWANDTTRFVTWLNALFDDGATYRRLTRADLAHADTALMPVLTRHSIWVTNDESRPALHHDDGVPWPYTLTSHQLAQYPKRIIEHLRPALLLTQIYAANPTPDRQHLLSYIHFFSVLAAEPADSACLDLLLAADRAHDTVLTLALALALAEDLTDHPYHRDRVLNLALNLDHALNIDCNQVCALARVQSSDSRFADTDGFSAALIREKAEVVAHDLRHIHSSDRFDDTNDHVHEFARALGSARNIHRVLALDIDRGRDIARSNRHLDELDQALSPDEIFAQQRVSAALDRAAVLDDNRNFHHNQTCALNQACAVDHDLPPTHDVARTLDVVRALDLCREIARELPRARDNDNDLVSTRTLSRAYARAHDLERTLARDLDRTFARTLVDDLGTRHSELLSAMMDSLSALFSSCPHRWNLDGTACSSMEKFIAEMLPTSTTVSPATEDPVNVIREALKELPNDSISSEVLTLGTHAYNLIEPILDRTSPADHRAFVAAGFGLVVAIALLRELGEQVVAARLAQALGALILLGEREFRADANDVLLLVRS
jgi:hypothetical protein